MREYTDPRCEALLPDQPSEWRGRVKTLVLDLEGLLVHKEWSRAKGWQVRKAWNLGVKPVEGFCEPQVCLLRQAGEGGARAYRR